MLARIAAEVEKTREQIPVKDMYEDVDLTGKILPVHLILVSIEASLQYLKPAAVFTCTDQGSFARRLAAFRLPVWIVAISPSANTTQGLLFSAGVAPVYQPQPPESWNAFVQDWVRQQELPGTFALLTRRRSAAEQSNH